MNKREYKMAGLVEGKVALVTGAGSGIGRACAQLFSREGARVLAVDIDSSAAEETAQSIRVAGGDAVSFAADMRCENEIQAMLEFVLERWGRLDCAHNNAGVAGVPVPFHELSCEQWQQSIEVNLTSVFLCMKHELLIMQKQGAGVIVNPSSGAGVIGAHGMAGYCASKHGILGLTKTAAAENVRSGIRINAVCPGSVETPAIRKYMDQNAKAERTILSSQPGGRLGSTAEIAEAVVWLSSDRSSFVTGESLIIDGGAIMR
jgi:NAD(P)-dependent dehydrogenase (short-subunit alcohol dehydrogenase family)